MILYANINALNFMRAAIGSRCANDEQRCDVFFLAH